MNRIYSSLLAIYIMIVLAVSVSQIAQAQCGFTGLAPKYCSNGDPITLTENVPGGLFTGNGISGNTFNPTTAGVGQHIIKYTNRTHYTVSQLGTFQMVSGFGWSDVMSDANPLENYNDKISDPVPIGFTFNFFGNSYTRLYVSTNGYVTFDPLKEDSFQAQTIPNALPPNNMISLVRTDLDPSADNIPGDDQIRYKVIGNAPDRIFVLHFNQVERAGSNTDEVSVQLKLYETTNLIEIHTEKNENSSGALTLQGLENGAGTKGFATPNRNNQNWTATNDFVSYSQCSVTKQTEVMKNANLGLGVSSNPALVCDGSSTKVYITNSQPWVSYQLQTSAGMNVGNAKFGNGSTLELPTGNITSTTTFRVMTNTGTSCANILTNNTTVFVVSIPPTPSISSSGSSVCDSTDPDVTLTCNHPPGINGYNWYKDGYFLGLNSKSITVSSPQNSGRYTVQTFILSSRVSCVSNISPPVAVTILPAPSSSLTVNYDKSSVCTRGTISATIRSSEVGVRYQLFDDKHTPQSTVESGTGGDLKLTSTPLNATQKGLYVKAINQTNQCSSNFPMHPISVGLLPPPTIASIPTICKGSTSPTLTATGSNINWFKNINLTQWVGSGNSYTPNQTVVNTNIAGTYRLYAVQTSGRCSGHPAVVDVVVNPVPLDQAIMPTSVSICKNTQAKVIIALSQKFVNYQLFDKASNTPMSDIFAGTGKNLEITSHPMTTSSELKIRATNSLSCEIEFTNTVTVTVVSPPSIPNAGSDQTQCGNSTFNISANTPTEGTGRWTIVGQGTIISPNSPTTRVTGVPAGATTKVRWVITNGTCIPNFDEISLTNNAPPTPSIAGASQVNCKNGTFRLFGNKPNIGNGKWMITGASNGAVITDPTDHASTVTGLEIGKSVTLNWVISNGNCTESTSTINLSNEVLPTGKILRSVSICEGGTANLNFELTGKGLFNIQYTDGTNIFSINNISNGMIVGVKPTNTTTYKLTKVQDLGTDRRCEAISLGDPISVTVIPNPDLSVNNRSPEICSGQPTDITINSNTAGHQIKLISVNYANGNVTGGSLSIGSFFINGNKINETLHNQTTTPKTVTYTFQAIATSTSLSCPLTPVTKLVEVIVKPEPMASVDNQTVCSGDRLKVKITNAPNNVPNTTFSWIAEGTKNVLGYENGDGSTINQKLITTDANPGRVVYMIEPKANGCTGNTKTMTVVVNPRPIVNAGEDYNVCNPDTIKLSGLIGGGATSGTWSLVSGGSGTLSQSTTANNIVTATYTVTPNQFNKLIFKLTTNDPDGAGPCIAKEDLVNVKVYKLPNVNFFGLPKKLPKNEKPGEIVGNKEGGKFTISPATKALNNIKKVPGQLDRAWFDPSVAPVGKYTITYTYTDPHTGCTNSVGKKIEIFGFTVIEWHLAEDAVFEDRTGRMSVCSQKGKQRLIAEPRVSTGNPGTKFESSTPGLVTLEPDGFYYINTDGRASATYEIKYTYINSTSAKSELTKEINIHAAPSVDFSVLNSCVQDDIKFKNKTTVPKSKISGLPHFNAKIIDWQWSFGGSRVSTVKDPSIKFKASGSYNVTLSAITEYGCDGSTVKPIRIGSVPKVDFAWSSICSGSPTEFAQKVQSDDQKGNTYEWTFEGSSNSKVSGKHGEKIKAPNNNGGRTTETYDKPSHKYLKGGNYQVKLNVKTADGCVKDATKAVFILPSFKAINRPSKYNPYFENFEKNDGGWGTSADYEGAGVGQYRSDTSWVWGIPNSKNINSTGNKAWWTGKNVIKTGDPNASYPASESSYVNGPCFDLSQLKRPMISLDIWVDLHESFDGAVLQYSIDGGAAWQNVGKENLGINWYNGHGIIGMVRNQAIGRYGWTKPTKGWVNARFGLNEIPKTNRSFVMFRVAFGTDPNSPPNKTFNGFAFDNIYIGEKKKFVLIEHFSNISPTGHGTNDFIYNMYDKHIKNPNDTVDFILLQYHLGIPNPNKFYKDNRPEQKARALFYGFDKTPNSIMDGLPKYSGFAPNKINHSAIHNLSLKSPVFDIELENLPADINTIKVKSNLIANEKFDKDIILNIAVVENKINLKGKEYRAVFKKLLYGTDGFVINKNWKKKENLEKTVSWDIDKNVYNNNDLSVVAFVQNKETKEVYQAQYLKIPSKQRSKITSTLNPPGHHADKMYFYPNPVNNELTISYPKVEDTKYNWEIVDQRGVKILNGEMNFDTDNEYKIDTSQVPNGVYIVTISIQNRPLKHHKIVVENYN